MYQDLSPKSTLHTALNNKIHTESCLTNFSPLVPSINAGIDRLGLYLHNNKSKAS